MDGRLRRLGIAAVVALAVGASGCALLSKDDSARLHQEAQADLTRWADAVAAAGGQTAFVPVGELTGQVGDREAGGWRQQQASPDGRPGRSRRQPAGRDTAERGASMAGRQQRDGSPDLCAASPGGAEGRRVWVLSRLRAVAGHRGEADGRASPNEPRPRGSTRLGVHVAGHGGHGDPSRDRRPRHRCPSALGPQRSARRYLDRLSDRSRRRASAHSLLHGCAGAGRSAVRRRLHGRGGRIPTAVVVIVTEHTNGLPVPCSAVGAIRTAEVELSAPLGERTVLEVREGLPVMALLTS